MQTAAIGFGVHSGWAAAVVVCGPLDRPVVVDRRKIQLVKTFSYTFGQPYHTAGKMERPGAAKFIRDMQTEAKGLAVSSLRSLQAKDVPIVVQDDAKGLFGEGVDGLLGMSFLSRFKLTVDARNVRISARK